MEPNRQLRQPGIERFVKFVRALPDQSPREMFQRLESLGYRGQPTARRALCLMAYRHVRRIKRIYLDGGDRGLLPRKANYLMVGPTGCGKTFLVEQLFDKILKLPTVLVDITTYSETGYVGQDPSSILTRLLHAADDNPLMASIGIVCLDEFDKIASGQNNAVFAGAGTTKDVTGMGVQRELLKMLESSEVVVPLELTHSSYGDHVVMSTADIAFVAAGAFSGFQQVAAQRASQDSIGFGRVSVGRGSPDAIAVGLSNEQVESISNFQAYGFLPELIARFTRIVPFQPLDTGTLTDILRSDVIERMTREFEDEGFALEVADEVLAHVVHEALARETGARGLASTLTRHLEETAFEAFGRSGGGRVQVRMDGGRIQVRIDAADETE
ncbi:AAA family ATPase [Haliangium ochraceum]|uniref:ATPase AAA-2 domain protein n=1 Tax=Haliangium ochraceum (strain DSM 14365 / JCM 11303 / SMP-2) TaxID=502025 RepID=D0LZH6_HALO1|nr:AAA family ATPase [Haliangium ochraceum]ACY17955.1 ATPase AAA-2 domain protein [Haliangium ochraceum DSM 14365]